MIKGMKSSPWLNTPTRTHLWVKRMTMNTKNLAIGGAVMTALIIGAVANNVHIREAP